MPSADLSHIDVIRAASRKMMRELDFMQTTLAATDYSPSAVHAIVEVGLWHSLTAAQLTDILGLDKSSVSRMVRKLLDAGELQESASDADGRIKQLTLTTQGRNTLIAIHAFGRRQISNALSELTEAQQEAVELGLSTYAHALEAYRLGQPPAPAQEIQIITGYQPGALGRIIQLHARYYSHSHGFGQYFESQVAAGLAEFAARLEKPRNQIWLAMQAGRIVGSVSIDGTSLGKGLAHLRWFIVDESLHGSGIGCRLLAAALAFCDRQGFAATQLWTFQGLDRARRLYENAGFVLTEEKPGDQWGKPVVEQRFVRLALDAIN